MCWASASEGKEAPLELCFHFASGGRTFGLSGVEVFLLNTCYCEERPRRFLQLYMYYSWLGNTLLSLHNLYLLACQSADFPFSSRLDPGLVLPL